MFKKFLGLALACMFVASSVEAAYSISYTSEASSPTDLRIYYPLPCKSWANILNDGQGRFYIPKAGTITACYGGFSLPSILGSAENLSLYIRLNNTTDTLVSNVIQLNAVNVPFLNNALNIAVTEGDFIQLKVVTPSWVTNPGYVFLNASIYIE